MPIFGWEGLKKLGRREQPKANENETGPAAKCPRCAEIIMKKSLEEHLWVCPSCAYHHRITARQRVDVTVDTDTFEEQDADLCSVDPLTFEAAKKYTDKLLQAQLATRELSAMVSGMGKIKGIPVAFGVTDSFFIMGSMGSVVGEKFTRLGERALDEGAPLVIVSGSGGGARMYEGMYSLMQMVKTSAILGRLQEAGIPFLSIVTDCTMAGIWASWAALGDVIMAEPKALIGFTGPRVIKTTINCELPEGFQLSEFLLEKGQVDMIVNRAEIPCRIGSLLHQLTGAPLNV